MAEAEVAGEIDVDEETPNYKAPEKKALDEIKNLDQDDESLNTYKQKLLGPDANPVFPDDPRLVIVKQLVVLVDGRDDVVMKLDGDLTQLKKTPVVLKEGTNYRVAVHFYVQREIVSGLRYCMKIFRGPIKCDSDSKMVGSYGPKEEPHVWVSSVEEAPKGMMSRGSYVVKSKFTDDDRNPHLEWEWAITIQKDW